MRNKYQTLAGNTVKLGLGTFGSKLLVFLMVRFYTEYLSPADYGTADLITQTANLLLIPRIGVLGAAIAALLILQAVFLTLQLPGWAPIQAVCLTLLLILNGKPLLLAVKKLFGARRKGVNL